jgi:hypothetical protein
MCYWLTTLIMNSLKSHTLVYNEDTCVPVTSTWKYDAYDMNGGSNADHLPSTLQSLPVKCTVGRVTIYMIVI